MAPDIPYYLFQTVSASQGHSLAGVFYICLPLGLLLVGVLHALLKRPLVELLPESHRSRLLPMAKTPFTWTLQRLLWTCLAVVFGAMTHVAWDSCTHATGWVVGHVSWLREAPLSLMGHEEPTYKILQHASTLLGMLFLSICYWRWYVRTQPPEEPSEPASISPRGRWLFLGFLSFLSMVVGAVAFGISYVEEGNLRVAGVEFVLAGMAAGCVLLIASAVGIRRKLGRSARA